MTAGGTVHERFRVRRDAGVFTTLPECSGPAADHCQLIAGPGPLSHAHWAQSVKPVCQVW